MFDELEKEIVELISADTVEVPPYPDVALRLNRLAQQERCDLRQLADMIKSDQALAATVLRQANSAFYSGTTQISSLNQAVSRIGAKELVRLAFAASVGSHALRIGPLVELRYLIWRQALTNAMLCNQIAEWRGLSMDDAFVCGLLHDFGMVVGLACIERILDKLPELRTHSEEEWLSFLRRHHVELGIVTAEKWGLPDMMTDIISTHHRPDFPSGFEPMRNLIVLADQLVELLETDTHISNERLDELGFGRDAKERTAITQLLPVLPEAVTSFMDLGEQRSNKRSSVKKRLVASSRNRFGHEWPVGFPVRSPKDSGDREFEALWISLKALTVSSCQPEQKNSMIRVILDVEPKPFEMHATIVSCTPDEDLWSLTLIPFALSRAEQTRFMELARSAENTAGLGGSTPQEATAPIDLHLH